MWRKSSQDRRGRRTARGESAQSDPLVGAILGSYRVMARIAEGGMGIIYQAEHLRLPRRVAIKVLKPELARFPRLVERFVDEARAVNQVRHPNLVDVIDVAEVSGDPPLVYLVMELLEGVDLSRHLRDAGALDPLEAVEIADAVAEALIAVHEQHILHRDLKAENIFLCIRPDGGTSVKLLDFGIATTFGGPGDGKVTAPGARVGTPDCMAPEQVSGEPLDERTDIYALGLVLYHMLNGAPAFHSTSINDVLSDQLYSRPPPLRRSRLRGEPVIPPALEQVVMRCLEKRREDRYPDVQAMRQAMWASIGVADSRLYLRRCVRGSVSLGEAPTLPPGALAASIPAPAAPASRGRWLATGALAGVAIPLMAILLRAPMLTAAVGPRAGRCTAPASAAAPARPTPAAAAQSPRLATRRSARLARPSTAPAAVRAAVPDPRLRRGPAPRRPTPTGDAAEDAHSPSARKARLPPAVMEQPELDRTVDPFSLGKAARPANPVAVRDGF